MCDEGQIPVYSFGKNELRNKENEVLCVCIQGLDNCCWTCGLAIVCGASQAFVKGIEIPGIARAIMIAVLSVNVREKITI
jgi:hypothetical protein